MQAQSEEVQSFFVIVNSNASSNSHLIGTRNAVKLLGLSW
jgi:hypothetical protein